MLAAAIAISVFLCASVATAAAATAKTNYGYLASFGSGENLWTGGEFDSVAVDPATGNIFVSENGQLRIRVYAPDPVAGGTLLTTIDLGATPIQPVNLAVDPNDGSIYVFDQFAPIIGNSLIAKLVSDGAPVPTYTVDPSFFVPASVISSGNNNAGLAVDPTTGDVLVSDASPEASGGGRVYRLGPDGDVLSSFDGADTSKGRFNNATSLAVDPSGAIYVADSGTFRVEKFSPSGKSLFGLPIPPSASPAGLEVDLETGEVVGVFRRLGVSTINGFTPAGEPTFTSRVPPSQLTRSTMGLAIDGAADRLYVASEDGTVSAFGPTTEPGLDVPIVSQVTTESANLSADVAPGGATTTARIEWCPASASCSKYALSNPEDPSNPWVRLPDHENLAGTGEETIEDDLFGLNPNTTYRVRAYALNEHVQTTSAITTFTTSMAPPVVQTGLASDLDETRAVLTGTVDARNAPTTYAFEYGLDSTYGSLAPVSGEGIAGTGLGPKVFSRHIAGLRPETTYHYRLVARNPAGETAGADMTFTTLAAGQLPPRRAYERVTPADKNGGAVRVGAGYQASEDGEAFLVPLAGAPSGAPSAPQIPRYLTRRGATGWEDWQSTDPPLGVSRALVTQTTLGVSSDFRHALVVSNRALTPGAIESSANLYVADLDTGAYQLVGASGAPGAFTKLAGLNTAYTFIAGAPDFSWVVLVSRAPLLPGVEGTAMYKWSEEDGLRLESTLPDGSIPKGEVWYQNNIVFGTREVADDGNTMYFALTSGEQGVYRRAGGQTTAISVSQIPGDPDTPLPGRLDGISRDGRYAIFHSGRLTPDAPDVPFFNLYRYDSVDGGLEFLGTISRRDGSQDGVMEILNISDDGETVYFHYNGETVEWHEGAMHTVAPTMPLHAWASPDSRYLAFEEGFGKAYLYDAGTHETVCISCPPAGEPTGTVGFGEGERWTSNRVPQPVTNDGRVFFDAPDRLLAADHNGVRDVYEFHDGVLTLISPGDAAFSASVVDSSADGRDVFFVTGQSLLPADDDGGLDVYDARIGGGFPESPPPPACVADACQGALGAAPAAPQPPTANGKRGKKAAGQSIGLRRLSASKLRALARGEKVRLQVTVGGPGKVSLSGKAKLDGRIRRVASGSVRAKGPGTVSIPFRIAPRALAAMRDRGSLPLRLTVGFGDAKPTVMDVVLRPAGNKKGDSR